MSTQRRESSSTLVTKTRRRGSRYYWQRTDCTDREGADGLVSLAPVTRNSRAYASALTARPFTTAVLATKSLQKDPGFLKLVCHDSPPQWTNRSRQAYRYSLSPISILSGSVRFHLASPQAPEGTSGIRVAVHQRHVSKAALFSRKSRPEDRRRRLVYSGSARHRWAERYDGQGNLHFKHAA